MVDHRRCCRVVGELHGPQVSFGLPRELAGLVGVQREQFDEVFCNRLQKHALCRLFSLTPLFPLCLRGLLRGGRTGELWHDGSCAYRSRGLVFVVRGSNTRFLLGAVNDRREALSTEVGIGGLLPGSSVAIIRELGGSCSNRRTFFRRVKIFVEWWTFQGQTVA
ncbi:hypothetical protein, variant [Cryptococcus amylolentus CBS 6039]|uniref:Uncharacterized protein n=1 Tax=Cryptococcus amylolentus CBS 6039 TaxID=1295533 RepID=A0A1E3HQ52_9TREE|nr:hypothetical protein L202_03912 [Cryptococcus amylolentus CBS 6039]XP_018993311.1 hypothetical protein, variant [Cryptococcus amylolentus CBS 6039]ODN78264.1 hypothetical protein L202_03912 [Cryptococcus amylolentus CBS 6039]ODN78265.1 hypothetical protein, variant [Cryptococcus amylolentus CBS 6039]